MARNMKQYFAVVYNTKKFNRSVNFNNLVYNICYIYIWYIIEAFYIRLIKGFFSCISK